MVFMGEIANRVPESGHGICFRDSNGVKDSAEVDSGASPQLECWNIEKLDYKSNKTSTRLDGQK